MTRIVLAGAGGVESTATLPAHILSFRPCVTSDVPDIAPRGITG